MKLQPFLYFIVFLLTVAVSGWAEEAPTGFDTKIMGDWVLENAKGTPISPMQIQKNADGVYQLVRIGGGALAVSGDYKLEGGKLVKLAKPNDPY